MEHFPNNSSFGTGAELKPKRVSTREKKGSAFMVKAEIYFKFFTNEALVSSCLALSALQQMES